MSQFSSNFNAVDRYLRRYRREYMAPLGLKGIHARLFMAICRTPGCSQDQLAKRMWFDKSTIARQMELLEKKGFITRQPRTEASSLRSCRFSAHCRWVRYRPAWFP